MPSPEYPAPDAPDSNEWFSLVRDNARDAMAALRRIRRRESEQRDYQGNSREIPYPGRASGHDQYVSIYDKKTGKTTKKEFSPLGRRALVGDDIEPEKGAA